MKSLDVPMGSELHRRIKEAVCARRKLSDTVINNRTKYWKKCDEEGMAYIHEKEADALRRSERDLDGVPQFTTLQIPYSYGLMMSAHTYWSSVFLSRNPIMQFSGRHGEAEMNVQAVEALMDYQTTVGGQLPPLYIWLFDVAKYGIGILWSYWDEEVSVSSRIEEVPYEINGIVIEGKTQTKKTTIKTTGYEGNRLFNVRPYDYICDPRVPLADPNKGEFVGRKVGLNVSTLVTRAKQGQYINIDYVRRNLKALARDDREAFPGTGSHELPDMFGEAAYSDLTSVTDMVPAVEMIITLIPSDWGLGSVDYPEKWVFTVVNEQVVIEAHPLGLVYDKFPSFILEYEIEGYSLFKRSMLDIARPMNYTLEWLINTHFYNVRKSLNGEYVFDPSLIVAKDLLDGKPGKRIRLKPEAYGRDVRTMITTLGPDAAVTQSHMKDTTAVMDLMQLALGVNDTVAGAINPGGRKSATEVRASTSSSVNRMKTIAEYFSATGFSSMAQHQLRATQQLYTAQKKFRIVGDTVADQAKFIEVTPELLAGAYDYVPVDGTLPVDRFALVNMWANLMTQMRNYPQVAMTYDIGKIFAWVAQLGGLKNIKQFRVQTMPPELLQQGAQAGNLIPMGGPQGGEPGRAGAATRGGDRNTPRVPGLTQVAGMGQAG